MLKMLGHSVKIVPTLEAVPLCEVWLEINWAERQENYDSIGKWLGNLVFLLQWILCMKLCKYSLGYVRNSCLPCHTNTLIAIIIESFVQWIFSCSIKSSSFSRRLKRLFSWIPKHSFWNILYLGFNPDHQRMEWKPKIRDAMNILD